MPWLNRRVRGFAIYGVGRAADKQRFARDQRYARWIGDDEMALVAVSFKLR